MQRNSKRLTLAASPLSYPTPALVTPRTAARELTPFLNQLLAEVRRELSLKDKDIEKVTNAEIEAAIQVVASRNGAELSSLERDSILELLEKEKRPFGILEELVSNVAVTDIIISSFGHIVVQQGRANYETEIRFPNQEAYETFVEKLLARAGTTYSTKKPITDGMIGALARIHAVHKCIADNGPYLTIRLNRFSSVTTRDLLKKGVAPASILSYLETLVRGGHTLLIVGEVGTGKTTLARALAASIPSTESILVIEDTPEIKLDHPLVRSVVTRPSNTDGEGRVSASEVIRGGMRMAMNRIVFGEIRDPEAAEAFIDVCASGHPGLSTIHAKNASDAIVRLQLFLGRAQKGVSTNVLSQQISTAVSVIVFIDLCRETRVRRIMEIKEIGGISDGVIAQSTIFEYQTDYGRPTWRMNNSISLYRDLLEEGPNPVRLSDLPRQIELSDEHLYLEAQQSAY